MNSAGGVLPGLRTLTLVALVAAFAILLNPVGFSGGGGDDGHYLDAARCWVAQGGMCLPINHWWSRWPVIGSVAVGIGSFGEARWSVGLGPLAWWIVALASAMLLARCWFGERAALVAGLVMATTPAFAAAALQPTADVPELALQLAALFAATRSYQDQRRGWAFIGGVLAALAFQARETSAIFLLVAAIAWLFLPADRRRVLLWSVAGFLFATLGEMATYALVADDALLRYHLALGHAGVPSAELPAGFDTRQSPLFNPAYIASWQREAGIRIFWPFDPWLNLLASSRINATLIAALLAMLAGWRTLAPSSRRALKLIAGAAALQAVLLVYALAVDPKPRMFLPLLAMAAITAGAVIAAVGRWRQSPLPFAAVGLAILLNLLALSRLPTSHDQERAARGWIAAHGGAIEIDEEARAYLTLVPEARALPTEASGRPLRIALSGGPCEEFVRAAPGRPDPARVIDAVGWPNPHQGQLCLLEYLGVRESGR